jgi:hypothetical protein
MEALWPKFGGQRAFRRISGTERDLSFPGLSPHIFGGAFNGSDFSPLFWRDNFRFWTFSCTSWFFHRMVIIVLLVLLYTKGEISCFWALSFTFKWSYILLKGPTISLSLLVFSPHFRSGFPHCIYLLCFSIRGQIQLILIIGVPYLFKLFFSRLYGRILTQ